MADIPVPDERTLKAMGMINIGVEELGVFWKHFRKADKDQLGSITVDQFYSLLGEERSIFGDGIFEINDIPQSGTVDFGEYMTAMVMYCLFEPREVLAFCMYVFDRDKNGWIEKDDLMLMLRVLYHSDEGKEFGGSVAATLRKMDFHQDGRVDFEELTELHRLFPMLFYPAFQIQVKMIARTMGKRWWDAKKRGLYEEKVRKRMIDQLEGRKERLRLTKLREKRVRRKMGICRYLYCPGQRQHYRGLFPLDMVEYDKNKEETDLMEQKKRQRELERRIREIALKNPETPAWKQYQRQKKKKENIQVARKAKKEKGGLVVVTNKDKGRDPKSMTERQNRMEARRTEKIANARAS